MAEINWGLLQNDPVGDQSKAFDYASKVAQSAANYQSGGQFAQGNYQGAATTQAQAGNIDQAKNIQDYGIQHFQAQQSYLQRAIPVFTGIYQKGGPQALLQAFDHVAPDLQTLGVAPDKIAQYRDAFDTDPQGTLQTLGGLAQHKFEYHTAGDTVFITNELGQVVGQQTGNKFMAAPAGSNIYQVGGDGASAVPAGGLQAPGGSPMAPGASPATQQAASLIPSADPNAMHAVESRNNPNAVSPAGAMGVSQVMPATAANPGYGVKPAQDNSPQELQRVGDDTLAAYTQHYGNPVLGHIAYNMGPGNTDKWLATGGDYSKLPDETQKYLGRIAVAQALPQGGQGASQDQQAPQSQTQQPLPGGARLIAQGKPVWHPPTPDEAKQYPGAVAMNINGEPKYAPASQLAANMTTDQMQPFVDNLKAGGSLPQSLARNPAAYAKVLQLASQQGVSMQDVLANQGTRKATQATFQQVSTRYAMVQTQEQAFQNSLDLAQQKIQALGNQNGGKFLLNLKNYLKTGVVGDPATGSAINAVDTAMNEYAKIIEGSTGNGGSSVSARADAQNMLSAADNLPSFMEKIGVLKADAGYKIGALKDQYDTLSSALHSIGDNKPAAPNAPAAGKVFVYDPKTGKLH